MESHSHLGELGGCPTSHLGHPQAGELLLELLQLLEELILLLVAEVAALDLDLQGHDNSGLLNVLVNFKDDLALSAAGLS